VAAALEHRPDVALLDIEMPGLDGPAGGLAAAALAEGASPLSEREREVLVAARDGGTAADIAARLHLSEGTVRNHLSAAIRKTDARSRLEALRTAEDKGWL
jgi:two-component system, NarL family, response regulator DesR